MNVFDEYVKNPELIPRSNFQAKTKVKSINVLTKDMTVQEFSRLENILINSKARIIGINKI